MKMMRFVSVLLAVLFLTVTGLKAQVTKDADNAFKYCQYEKALDEYKKVIKKVSKNQIEVRRITFQIAEC